MSWFTNLFGGSETAGKAIDAADRVLTGVGTWIDERDYTQEEKAKATAKAVDAHLDLVKAIANENSMRSVTRRWLAWGITGFTVFWASVAMVFAIQGKSEIVKDMVSVINAFSLGVAFLAVIGLYFGVQLLRR